MTDLMPVVPSLGDIAFRLVLTIAACSLIGLNRQAGGHAAGFRTTVLVGLAASLAMIQANLLLAVDGKTGHSFSVMDTLRLPLGILTGVGFIGGGAILKRGDFVRGITTAATLWVVTSIGLCLGGGQIIVGCIGAALAFLVLSPFKLLDERLPQRRKARVVVTSKTGQVPDFEALLPGIRCKARFLEKRRSGGGNSFKLIYEISWTESGRGSEAQVIASIEQSYTLERFELLSPTA